MLKLWGRASPARTQRVPWTLAENGIAFELILASATMGAGGHVFKGNIPFGIIDTPEYLAMNPTGRVPTIDDDGFVLWESNSVVRYLAMQYAPEQPYGENVRTFASASRWLDWENNELLPPQHELVMQLVRLPQHERRSARLEQARKAFIKALGIAEGQLGRTRYIAGNQFTYGNIPLGVRVHRWYMLPLERPKMAHLERWYADVRERPAFHKWTAPPE